ALVRAAIPQSSRQLYDRSASTAQHDQPTLDPSTFLDHATSSFGFVRGDARFVNRVCPATSTSIPQRRNVEYPSTTRLTMGSPAKLNEVLSNTGIPVRRPSPSSSACRRGAMSR